MYLLSIYFQDTAALWSSPLEAGLATLPATVGLVLTAPLVPRLAACMGGREVVLVGFLITAGGFAWMGLVNADWGYGAFLVPLVAVAVGMGLSNMARYVGAAIAAAVAAAAVKRGSRGSCAVGCRGVGGACVRPCRRVVGAAAAHTPTLLSSGTAKDPVESSS